MMNAVAAHPYTIQTHNGKLTVVSHRTGEHRTFRIKTQDKDARFAPGERIVSLLIGPDNVSSYKGFGFVMPDGRIAVWKKDRGTKYEELARFLEKLGEHEAAGRVDVHWSVLCRRCNRELTTPESIESGIGPVCAEMSYVG